MKKILSLFLFLSLGSIITSARDNPEDKNREKEQATPSGCSVITISKGDRVFFGGNDDFINPDQYYWVEPGDSSC